MRDAFSFLNTYHEEELKKKTTPDEEHVIKITDTEKFLFNLFKGIWVLGISPSDLSSKLFRHFKSLSVYSFLPGIGVAG